MKTVKLYRENVYLESTSAVVKAIENGQLVLDQTIFFPEGGGQTCDLGTIDGINVLDVQEENGIILHKVALEPSEVSNFFVIGQEVNLNLDWNHRFDNMQRHCGEHILSGVFHSLTGGINRGFHMGTDYMTIDISLENSDKKELTTDDIQRIEDETNKAIWANLPVVTRTFETRSEAEHLPMRKPLAIDEEITIVSVGHISNPSDCVACCGTHPSTSSQVGLLKIYKAEKYKGMYRIFFEAGKRAMDDFVKKHNIVTNLYNKYSAGLDDLEEKIKIQDEKTKEMKNQLFQMKKLVTTSRVNHILEALNGGKTFVCETFDDMSPDDIQTIGKGLFNNIGKALVIIKTKNTAMLFSDFTDKNPLLDCGKLVKDNGPVFQGKGGGTPTNSRGIFQNSQNLDLFVASIKSLLNNLV